MAEKEVPEKRTPESEAPEKGASEKKAPEEERQKGIPWWMLTLILVVIVGLAAFIFLTRGIVIEGTIVDAVKGTPIKDATITLGTHSTTSDENGRFSLRVPTLEGEVVVNALGYEPLSVNGERNLSLSLVPLPEKVASYWFAYWKDGNYEGMYNLLTNECRSATSREAFQEEFSRYKMEIVSVKAQKTGEENNTANVSAEVEINTPLGKQILRFSLQLLKEEGIWKVVWYPQGQGMVPLQPPY